MNKSNTYPESDSITTYDDASEVGLANCVGDTPSRASQGSLTEAMVAHVPCDQEEQQLRFLNSQLKTIHELEKELQRDVLELNKDIEEIKGDIHLCEMLCSKGFVGDEQKGTPIQGMPVKAQLQSLYDELKQRRYELFICKQEGAKYTQHANNINEQIKKIQNPSPYYYRRV